jgi:mandelamide amidase
LGVLDGYFDEVDDDTEALLRRFVQATEAHGATVTSVSIDPASEALPALFDVVLPESWELISELLDRVEPGAQLADRLDMFSPAVRAVLASQGGRDAQPVPAAQYLKALWVTRRRHQEEYARAFTSVDAFVCATTPSPAVLKTEDPEMTLNGASVPTFETFIRNCVSASLTGNPAISLPIGVTADGLPVGAQLIGPAMGDRQLLHIAAACERILEQGGQ